MRILLLVVAALTGCPACTYPFELAVPGALSIPLGVVSGCVGAGTIPEDGLPDQEGNLTHFTHTVASGEQGTRCLLRAEWSGPLMDVDALRANAEQQLRARGLDPKRVAMRITSITPTVDTVALRGRGTDRPALLAPGIISYRGALSIPGDEEIIVVTVAPDQDPAEPWVSVRESPRLVELANEAWTTGESIPATGTAEVSINLARIGDVGEVPENPRLRVVFTIALEGNAGFAF